MECVGKPGVWKRWPQDEPHCRESLIPSSVVCDGLASRAFGKGGCKMSHTAESHFPTDLRIECMLMYCNIKYYTIIPHARIHDTRHAEIAVYTRLFASRTQRYSCSLHSYSR